MIYLKSKVGKSACLPVVSWVVTVACRGHTQGSHRPPPLPLRLFDLRGPKSPILHGKGLFFPTPEFRLGKRVSEQGERRLGIEGSLGLTAAVRYTMCDVRWALYDVRCKMRTMCDMRGGLQVSSRNASKAERAPECSSYIQSLTFARIHAS